MSDGGLGFRFSEDDRDFPMRSFTPRPPPTRRFRYWWDEGWWGDQGTTPQCVAYSWLHFLEDRPRGFPPRGDAPMKDPRTLYCMAQKVDPWPGDCETRPHYEGTAVRAGAKVLHELGYISRYEFATDIDTIVDALLTRGPVVVGTGWFSGMNTLTREGLARATGRSEGGHAYLLNGVNRDRGLIRCKNSWGRKWGQNGRFWLDFETFDRLISDRAYGCVAVAAPSMPG